MKTCTKCKRTLPLSDFPLDKKGKGGCASQCRDCRNKYYKEHYECAKRIVDAHKTYCAKCGCNTPYVLTFHHIDHRTKLFEVSVSRRKLSAVLEELEKCICLCHNCHQTFHYFYGINPNDPVEKLDEFLSPEWCPPK